MAALALVVAMPPDVRSFDRVAHLYDATRSLPEGAETRLVRAIRSAVGDGPLLELGVGTGRLGGPLRAAGVRVSGVDVSRRMLERARAKGVPVLQGDVRRLPVRTGSFAAAMSTHLLHLVSGWPRVLEEVGRVARVCYVSVLEHDQEVPDLHEVYRQGASDQGVPTDHPGLAERRLPERLTPDRRIPVGRFVRVSSADEALRHLAERAFSSQWSVPDDVHRTLMRGLVSRYRGTRLTASTEVEVAVWRVSRLVDFAKTEAGGDPPAPLRARESSASPAPRTRVGD